MSQSSDLDVLKDIPGYKAILKSVLKSQIQLLIEQLADHTGEESIILTASINDGTLSHLGSSTGKGFLEGRDEMKSQFLGYCLKTHHRKKTLETKTPPYQRSNQRHMPYRTPQKQSRVHPVSLQRANLSDDTTSEIPGTGLDSESAGSEIVKQEGSDSNQTDADSAGYSSTQTSFPSSLQLSHTQTSGDLDESGQGETKVQGQTGDSVTEDGSANIKIEPITENEMELEITGVEPGNASLTQDNWGQGQMGYGPSGAEGDSSLNLSGDPSSYSQWNTTVPSLQPVQLVQYDTTQGQEPYTIIYQPIKGFDTNAVPPDTVPPIATPSSIATPSVTTLQPVKYKSPQSSSKLIYLEPNIKIVPPQNADDQTLPFTKENYGKEKDKYVLKRYICEWCGKRCLKPSDLTRHIKVHTGEKSFECEKCKKRFRERFNLMSHLKKCTA